MFSNIFTAYFKIMYNLYMHIHYYIKIDNQQGPKGEI